MDPANLKIAQAMMLAFAEQTGITGARHDLPPALNHFIQRVRAQTSGPLAVGFGISTPEQVQAVGNMADGVIVGSALVKAVDRAQDKARAAADFVHQLTVN